MCLLWWAPKLDYKQSILDEPVWDLEGSVCEGWVWGWGSFICRGPACSYCGRLRGAGHVDGVDGCCSVGNSACISLVRERCARVAQKTKSCCWCLGLCGWIAGWATRSHWGRTGSLASWKWRSWRFSCSYEVFEVLVLVRLRVGFQHQLEVIGRKSMRVCFFINVWLHAHWDNVQMKQANHPMAFLGSTLV